LRGICAFRRTGERLGPRRYATAWDLGLRPTGERLGRMRPSTARLISCSRYAPAARASSPLGDFARRELETW